ncbi:MAG: CBS domain-containing protein [Desulfobacterales bacterium]|nr:CBS domain-containing protein [Desulfobacterales bacterium]
MKTITSKTVLRPYHSGAPHDLTIAPDDRLAHAVEKMLSNNRTRIVVADGIKGPVGMIYLEDALKKLGIEIYV